MIVQRPRQYGAHVGDGGAYWAGRCGGNARNNVCRLATDIRTTQGQASFGHHVETVTTYSKMLKTFVPLGALFKLASNAPTLGVKHPQKENLQIYFSGYSGKIEPQCQATPVKFGSPQ
jgi:hypothetical protein